MRFARSSEVKVFDQIKVYGAVPPDGVKLIAPEAPPKQATGDTAMLDESAALGWVTVIAKTEVHPLKSFTVTE